MSDNNTAEPTETNTTVHTRSKSYVAHRVIAALLVLSVLANAALCVLAWRYRKAYNELNSAYADEFFVFPSLPVEAFERKVASGDEFIAFISRPNCSSCQNISADFIDFCRSLGIEDKIFHVNVVYFHRDTEAWNAFKERYGLSGTPSFVRFSGGVVTSAYSWTSDNDSLIEGIKAWVLEQRDYLGIE